MCGNGWATRRLAAAGRDHQRIGNWRAGAKLGFNGDARLG
jgi:hypothetical protein